MSLPPTSDAARPRKRRRATDESGCDDRDSDSKADDTAKHELKGEETMRGEPADRQLFQPQLVYDTPLPIF